MSDNRIGIGTDKQGQKFFWAAWEFDIGKADTIIANTAREIHQADVKQWANAYNLDHIMHPDRSMTTPLLGPDPKHFNIDYAMTTDLTKPVIMALIEIAKQPTALMIDGTHRLYRAYAEDVETIPAYVLTVDETLTIRSKRYR